MAGRASLIQKKVPMNKQMSTIFNELKEYQKACDDYKRQNPGKGAVSTTNEAIKQHGAAILAAMKEISEEVAAPKGPMEGLRCFVNFDGLGSGRAKGENGFYVTWEMGSPVVEGVALNCYVAMNFIFDGDRTQKSLINVGCGFWVKPEKKSTQYSEARFGSAKNLFGKFRNEHDYPKEAGKPVKNDCDMDSDLVSCISIEVARPEPGADFVFTGEDQVIAALQEAREIYEKVLVQAECFATMPIQELLAANHQIILTGAPGTGKTFLAEKRIAPSFIEAKDENDASERIYRVQFHPGYDYSDFVIGLKPVLVDDKGNECDAPSEDKKAAEEKKVSVTFKWKDGIFLDVARKAKTEYDEAKKAEREPKKYVLIIDEINRADLSRVFGELFSQLESGYRYRLTKSTTKEKKGILLPNKTHLLIPENLYIIGTMNDIDRSVESMDFAMRRRFGWHEVTAEDSRYILAKVDGKESPLLKAMDRLNGIIGGNKIKGLGKDYCLGGAIFAKIEQYNEGHSDDEKYELLWRNHIANTIRDYLRGNPKADALYDELKSEYDKALHGSSREAKENTNAAASKDQPAEGQAVDEKAHQGGAEVVQGKTDGEPDGEGDSADK